MTTTSVEGAEVDNKTLPFGTFWYHHQRLLSLWWVPGDFDQIPIRPGATYGLVEISQVLVDISKSIKLMLDVGYIGGDFDQVEFCLHMFLLFYYDIFFTLPSMSLNRHGLICHFE